MSIGSYKFELRCWRFPRQGFALPRNDMLDGAVQQHVKHQFIFPVVQAGIKRTDQKLVNFLYYLVFSSKCPLKPEAKWVIIPGSIRNFPIA